MKKKVLLLILFLLLFPSVVLAKDTCNKNDIKIETIELSDIRGNAEELSSSNNNNNKINLNTKMNVIGDSLTYKVVVKNTSNSDYTFEKNTLTKDYLSYDITYEDDSNIIKPNEEKVIYLRLSYDNKPEVESLVNGVLKENNEISFNLTKETSFINPETGNKILLSLIYLLIPVITFFYLIKKKKPTFMLLLLITIIPYIVNASCTCITTLDINLSLEIDRKEAVFLPGKEVNIKMKELAGDDTSTSTTGYGFKDQNITAIKKSEVEPIESNKEEKNVVSMPDSLYPIYMWYEEETIYWWSEDNTPALNEDASYMFFKIVNLSAIEGLKKFDSSSATTLAYFLSWSGLLNIDPLANWNTLNVISMEGLFTNNKGIESVDGLRNWDTSNVQDMSYMFYGEENLKTLIDLELWDTSNVTNMYGMFYNNSKLASLEGLEKWNISSVTNMSLMFYNDSSLTSLLPLAKWDTSSVKIMSGVFWLDTSLTTLDGIGDWDISNVTDLSYMFHNCLELNDVSALSNWNVSNVENMRYMFNISNDVVGTRKYSNLAQLDISNWNMAKVKDYRYFIESLRYVTTEFTIRSTNIEQYTGMLADCANKGGEVIINYTSETESIVEEMLTTISSGANIKKGSLVE